MPTTCMPPDSEERACWDVRIKQEEAEQEVPPPADYASPPCYLAEFADFDAESDVAD